jgi:hypothetical protein
MISAQDEYRHAAPAGLEHGLWGDTLWLSVVDRPANVFGIIHFHLTNRGWGRFESLFVIDGVQQLYGNKHPLGTQADAGPWRDGVLGYLVVRPLEEVRVTFDGPRYGFDLTFRGRFPVFDYADSVHGNPLAQFHFYGGHFEQAMHCSGQVRRIDSWAHRDHSWSTRFAEEPPWHYGQANHAYHYWPSIQLPDRHINAFGIMDANAPALGKPRAPGEPPPTLIGGFVASAAGVSAIRAARAEILLGEDQRSAEAFRFAITLPDGAVIHARTGRKYGQVKLWDRGDNDLENRFDCYEPFFDFEIEETGERGYGVAEYSIMPPWPRWLV